MHDMSVRKMVHEKHFGTNKVTSKKGWSYNVELPKALVRSEGIKSGDFLEFTMEENSDIKTLVVKVIRDNGKGKAKEAIERNRSQVTKRIAEMGDGDSTAMTKGDGDSTLMTEGDGDSALNTS